MNTIKAQPYDYTFEPQHTALVIIDMQRDFIEDDGFGAVLGNKVSLLAKIIPTVKQLLDVFRDHNLTVIHTQEGHKSDLSDCPESKLKRGNPILGIGDEGPMGRVLIKGAYGYEIVPELAPVDGEVIIEKPGKGAFYNTNLQEKLTARGITHLLITGVTTDVCVQTTMREANDRGYECLLIEDATESYFPEFKQATLDMITAQGGIIGWRAFSEQVISAINQPDL